MSKWQVWVARCDEEGGALLAAMPENTNGFWLTITDKEASLAVVNGEWVRLF